MKIWTPAPSFVVLLAQGACVGTSANAPPTTGTEDFDAATAIGDAGAEGGGEGGDSASPVCALSYDQLNASPKVNAQSTYAWTCTATTREMTGDGIPDHPVIGGTFATPIAKQQLSISFPLQPAPPGDVTARFRQATGYALNSVKFDPDTAATCAASATSPQPGDGCVMVMGRDPWLVEAIGGAFKFGTDENNGHTQPNGQYHYHGMPEGLLAAGVAKMTLVGFAVDGFPIYARFGRSVATDASSPVKVVRASWQLKADPDVGRPSVDDFPMGTFTADYAYVAGSGDLDECNGRTGVTPEFPGGTYHYYITDTYPFIQRCIKGTPR